MVCPEQPSVASLFWRHLWRGSNECSTCQCVPEQHQLGWRWLDCRRETTHFGGGCEGWRKETDASREGTRRVEGEEWAAHGGHQSHRTVEGGEKGPDKSTLTEQLGVGEAIQHGLDWGAPRKPLESGYRKLRLLSECFPGGQRQVANEGSYAESQGRQNWFKCRTGSCAVYEQLFRILNLNKSSNFFDRREFIAAWRYTQLLL